VHTGPADQPPRPAAGDQPITAADPSWGEPYGDTRYQTPQGQVRLYRNWRGCRWYAADRRQVGPEQRNVAAALAHAAAQGWRAVPSPIRDPYSAPRWVGVGWERNWPLVRDGAGCRWCGWAGNVSQAVQAHEAVACLACGTVQCKAKATCAACLVGWLPGWSRSVYRYDQAGRDVGYLCGYRGCGNEAVADAPRVDRVCNDHLSRVKTRGITLERRIQQTKAISLEHGGGSFQQWQWMVWRDRPDWRGQR
jgi:hypothetical protein